jgi:hypothetical protein
MSVGSVARQTFEANNNVIRWVKIENSVVSKDGFQFSI